MLQWNGQQSVMAAARRDRRRREHSRGGSHSFRWEDIFLYWWVVVKTGLDHVVASKVLFRLPHSTATKAFVSMTAFQRDFFRIEFPVPSRIQIQQCMPESYVKVYGTRNIAWILDCTELFIPTPSCPMAQRACFSSYKHHCTGTSAGAISPGGAAVFCSDAYPGSISDTAIVRVCGFLDKLRPGDKVGADKGFYGCAGDLLAKGCDIAHPPRRFPGQPHLTADEAGETQRQANLRIHVERAYSGPRKYKYIGNEGNIDWADLMGTVFEIVYFVHNNFHLPLVGTTDRPG